MHTLGQNYIWSYVDGNQELTKVDNLSVRKSSGHDVGSYLELAKKVSALQFKNPEYVLLFRGQNSDFKNRLRHSSLKPSLFRPVGKSRQPPAENVLQNRFARLVEAERLLLECFGAEDPTSDLQMRRHRLLRWAILQHYEICNTPLLDVTHSLRIAASFASLDADEHSYLYVLAVPNISGAITASAEAGLQIVRLSSICPPTAIRPHIQEGYLLGEYPEMSDVFQKQHYASAEVDFGRRLIAKFRFDHRQLWSSTAFPPIGRDALYPDAGDPLATFKTEIQRRLYPETKQ